MEFLFDPLFHFITWMPFGLIAYTIPAATPSWRWLIGCAALIGGPLLFLLLTYLASASPQPPDFDRPGFFQILILSWIGIPFAWGTVVRCVSLAIYGGDSFHRTYRLYITGFAILIAVPAVQIGLEKWRQRAPNAACRNATFEIDVATLRMAIPVSPFISIGLGHNIGTDSYHFANPINVRELCTRTDTGHIRTRATRISLNLYQPLCNAKTPSWAQAACASLQPGDERYGGLRTEVNIFSLADVALSEFQGSASSASEA